MKIYQYRNNYYTGKLHIVISDRFLCGEIFDPYIDKKNPNEINFSKGICKHCSRIYKHRHKNYKKDLNFEVIKLKLGVKV